MQAQISPSIVRAGVSETAGDGIAEVVEDAEAVGILEAVKVAKVVVAVKAVGVVDGMAFRMCAQRVAAS